MKALVLSRTPVPFVVEELQERGVTVDVQCNITPKDASGHVYSGLRFKGVDFIVGVGEDVCSAVLLRSGIIQLGDIIADRMGRSEIVSIPLDGAIESARFIMLPDNDNRNALRQLIANLDEDATANTTQTYLKPNQLSNWVDGVIERYKAGAFKNIGFDLETTSLDPRVPHGAVTTVSVYTPDNDEAMACVFRHPELNTPSEKKGIVRELREALDAVVQYQGGGLLGAEGPWDAGETLAFMGDSATVILGIIERYKALEGDPWGMVTSADEDAAIGVVVLALKKLKSKVKKTSVDTMQTVQGMLPPAIATLDHMLTLTVSAEQQMECMAAIDKLVNNVPFGGHNIKFDISYLKTFNCAKSPILSYDSFVDATLLYEQSKRKNLGELSGLCGVLPKTWKDNVATHPRIMKNLYGKRYDRIPLDVHEEYAAIDSVAASKLHDRLQPLVESREVDCTWLQVMMLRAIVAFSRAEQHGFTVDTDIASDLSVFYGEQADKLLAELSALPTVKHIVDTVIKEPFNPRTSGANSHLAPIMFSKAGYGLTPKGHTKTGAYETGKEVREELLKELKALTADDTQSKYVTDYAKKKEAVTFLELLTKYVLYSTYKSNYFGKLELDTDHPRHVYPTSFKLAGATVSGRASSGLHLTPRDSDVKKMYVSAWGSSSQREMSNDRTPGTLYKPALTPSGAHGGGLMVVGDFSQLELYIAAIVANETKMLEGFRSGEDIHVQNAKIMNKELAGLSVAEIKKNHKKERTAAKACFVGETLVKMLDGTTRRIEDMGDCVGKYVYSMKSGRVPSFNKILNWGITKYTDELVDVEFDGASTIRCTPDHEFMLIDGSYCEARHLEGRSIMPLDTNLVKCSTVTPVKLDTPVPVYDIEVENDHNFCVALSDNSGVIVHNCGFGILYGVNPDTPEMVEAYKLFFKTFPNIKNWIAEQHSIAKRKGYITTPFGRTRQLPDAKLDPIKKRGMVNAALRRAVNGGIQSPASDVSLDAVTLIQERLVIDGLNSVFIGSVHDSALTDTYPGELAKVLEIMSESTHGDHHEFMHGNKLNFDLSVGTSWGRLLDISNLSIDENQAITMSLEGTNVSFNHFKRELQYAYNMDIVDMTVSDYVPETKFDSPYVQPAGWVEAEVIITNKHG